MGLGLYLLVALAACGPTYHIALKPEHAAAITSTRVHAILAQEEVDAAVEVSNHPVNSLGLLGALVGAVVDAAITSDRAGKAAQLLEPIRKEVSDFDFRAAFFDSLQRTLPSLHVLRTAQLTTSKLPLTPELRAVVRKRTQENTLLSLLTRYEFSTDFRTFSISTRAEIWRTGPPTPEDEPLYLGTFLYASEPIVTLGGPEEAARAWAGNGAEALRSAMLKGIDETMKMLVIDLGGTPGAGKKAGHPAAPVAASVPAAAAPPAASRSGAPAAASPPVASPATPASPATTAPEAPITAGSPAVTAADGPLAIASGSPAAASGSPAVAQPGASAAITATPASSPTVTPAPRPAVAAAPVPAASTAAATPAVAVAAATGSAPRVASASRPAPTRASSPARPRYRREIVRRDNGIMYSAPREEHAAVSSSR